MTTQRAACASKSGRLSIASAMRTYVLTLSGRNFCYHSRPPLMGLDLNPYGVV